MDLHQQITDKIVTGLETASAADWRCPWHRRGGGLPINAKTSKPYRGINVLSLWAADQVSGFGDARWATYRQWSELGGQVRRGEKSSLVVFYRDYAAENDDGDPERRFVARASFAFNASQVDGVAPAEPLPVGGFEPIEVAEATIKATSARIDHQGEMAAYIPSQDRIVMPPRDRFTSADGYYSTMFHELGHWTGHASRLDRDLTGRFKTASYAAERAHRGTYRRIRQRGSRARERTASADRELHRRLDLASEERQARLVHSGGSGLEGRGFPHPGNRVRGLRFSDSRA